MQKISRLMPDDFYERLSSWKYILIDFRTYEEKIYYWYISNTNLFIDVYSSDIVEKINLLDKQKKYLIYCFHWNRTQWVLDFMKNNWFVEVYDLIGGIEYRKEYGYKMVFD